MRSTTHATVENADGSFAPQVEIGEVTRDAGEDPASGLGLFVREANALLRRIQSVVLNEQADVHPRRCRMPRLWQTARHQGHQVPGLSDGQR